MNTTTTNTMTTYEAWNKGLISGFGSFHTSLLETYRKADDENRDILNVAFPNWFVNLNY